MFFCLSLSNYIFTEKQANYELIIIEQIIQAALFFFSISSIIFCSFKLKFQDNFEDQWIRYPLPAADAIYPFIDRFYNNKIHMEKGQFKQKNMNNQDSKHSQPLEESSIDQNPCVCKNNQGLWLGEEQEKYIIFLEVYKKVFQSRQKRKETRIFKLMGDFIKTRDGIQCRSHHMKQLKTHKGKIRSIISDFKRKCDSREYNKKLEKIKKDLIVVQEQTQEKQEIKLRNGGKGPQTIPEISQNEAQIQKVEPVQQTLVAQPADTNSPNQIQCYANLAAYFDGAQVSYYMIFYSLR